MVEYEIAQQQQYTQALSEKRWSDAGETCTPFNTTT